MKLSLWAPYAHTVEYLTSQSAVLATPEDAGMWSVDLPAGERYHIRLDGGMNLPDPRSMCQPEGPHGPSVVVDPSQFVFHHDRDAGDLTGRVWYELHVGTFTPEGTLTALIDKLDDLCELGVDVIELMPIAPTPGTRNWGYDGVSLFAINPVYGTPQDLVTLVDAIHARQMAVALDVVYNHLGPDGNYLAQFGPYFTDHHHTPWGEAVNMDAPGSRHVRQYLIDNALQWLENYHFDALRLDAVDYLYDDSSRHILAELSDAVGEASARSGRTFTLVYESDANDPVTFTPTSAGGRGADAQWADDIHHALHVWLTGETNAYYQDYVEPGTLEKALTDGFTRIGQISRFRGVKSGAPLPANVSGHVLMVYDENHDQIGNRYLSDRPTEKLSPGQIVLSRGLILLSPFTPMLFMGEEWATTQRFPFFTDFSDEIGQHILAGRMNEFSDWGFTSDNETMIDPQSRQAFDLGHINWDEAQLPTHKRIREFVRQLIALRKSTPDIASGDRSATTAHVDAYGGWLRRGDTLVVFSQVDHDNTVNAPVEDRSVVLSWEPVRISAQTVTFSGSGLAILQSNGASL
ncbi:malto-oligosyltrehalose trehalohydrolase [Arcanobacterium canis]